MRIQGKDKVEVMVEAKYKQPYPVATKNDYFVGDKKADLVCATDEVTLQIDGVPYKGVHVYLLFKE